MQTDGLQLVAVNPLLVEACEEVEEDLHLRGKAELMPEPIIRVAAADARAT